MTRKKSKSAKKPQPSKTYSTKPLTKNKAPKKKPRASSKESSQKKSASKDKLPPNTLLGVIHLHSKGFGFVTPHADHTIGEDIFIPKHQTQNAMDGDEVKISFGPSSKADKGPEGIVLEVISRKRHTLIGAVFDENKKHLTAYCPMLGEKKMVSIQPDPKLPLRKGDRVVLEVISWGDYPYLIKTKPLHLIGSIADPSIDVEVAIKEYEIKEGFSISSIEEAKAHNQNPQSKDLKGREDLSSLETFTIDPDTAKDYDDALSLTKSLDGHYHLVVHIADVSHYVERNSSLDLESSKRCLSAYFPGKCVPMLPEELSNGLCSLKEGVIRLTISVFMEFNPHGELLNHDIKKSFIKSHKRFTYKEAKLALDGQLKTPHLPTLKHMVDLCHLLQKKRRERGSVEFFLPEVVIRVDDKGFPTGFEIIEYDITHQLVEEFMLKANELVAKSLIDRGVPAIFRVHDAPSEQDLKEFCSVATSMGFKLPPNPKPEDLQKLFEKAKTSPHLEQLSIAFIRSMKLAIYSEENIGHFGLSLEHYSHFTSPIRRYTDLIIHRLLFEEPYTLEELQTIAKNSSEKERVHFKAEQSVIELKKLRFLQQTFDNNPNETYTAIISKVKPFGIYFEVAPLMIEGFIHVSELGSEYFIYNEKNKSFIGERTNTTFKCGLTIYVTLIEIDLLLREAIWSLTESFPTKKKTPLTKKKKK